MESAGDQGGNADDSRLLEALRERQALLERLSRLQRAIVDRRPLHEILEDVVEGAHDLVDTDAAALRLRDPADPDLTTVVASIGGSDELLSQHRRMPADEGLGGRAMRERRLVVADAVSGADSSELELDLAASDLRAAAAAPLYEGGEIAGSLALGSREPGREFGAREQQLLLAFAEHASLALGHAQAVEEALTEAFHDSLTGIPNRALFLDRLSVAVARAGRTGTPVGVLFCDIDGFKTVNDSLGHQAGDALLVLVAERLGSCLRPADTLARLGGDEFAVLLEELREPEDAARAAQRMLDALEEPFELRGREIFISASIGISAGAADADNLLRDADLAMYRAKSLGRGRYAAYEPHMHTAVVERLELEVDLKRAIERGELILAYQPIYDIRANRIVALEALVRWEHPTRGLVQPDSFVPLAEESGHILALGRWVLRAAVHQGALWRARYPTLGPVQIGVNISAAQLREPGLVEDVTEVLASSQLDPDALTLEITESVLMEDSEAAIDRLSQLKELGVHLAIDDFGTGYSSLTYLKRFPLDNLKVDRQFVAAITHDDPEPPLLRAILDLAQIFDLRPVAEGIERPEQVHQLVAAGCDLGQGNLLSSPLSPADADALLMREELLGERPGAGAEEERPADASH
jgi:diguanylate cyclase (GGDEF)-like protein